MASRIVAAFSQRDIEALGRGRWSAVQEALTPGLNMLAGCAIFWQTTESNGAYALAQNPIGEELLYEGEAYAFLGEAA